jgi:hypothetical protein
MYITVLYKSCSLSAAAASNLLLRVIILEQALVQFAEALCWKVVTCFPDMSLDFSVQVILSAALLA